VHIANNTQSVSALGDAQDTFELDSATPDVHVLFLVVAIIAS
jgi:hypothetical protein